MSPAAPNRRARWGLLLALLAGAPLLSGYVLPPEKVLQRWFHDGSRPRVALLPALLPVRVQGRDGELLLARRGPPALAVESVQRPVAAALTTALELLLATDPEAAAAVLTAAGVDLERAGYARHPGSTDGVAHTLGARGEGERELPQVWFGRTPLTLCRVRLGAEEVEIGPPVADGWPGWLRLADGTLLEVTGAPTPTATRPAWAAPAAPLTSFPSPAPLGDWRGAFETPGL